MIYSKTSNTNKLKRSERALHNDKHDKQAL